MPSDLEQANAAFRDDLLRQERSAAATMARAYGKVWGTLKAGLDDLTSQMTAALDAGEEITPAWLLKQARYQSLLVQVNVEISRLSDVLDTSVAAQQQRAVEAALEQGDALMRTALGLPADADIAGVFNRLPAEAVADLIGNLGDGSPVRTILNGLGPDAANAISDALIQGVALGHSPVEVARMVREALAGNMARALTISRTEVLRAHRQAAQRLYRANDDVLDGWVWLSALDATTCPSCAAMHGTIHPLDEDFGSHPNCRCSTAPYVPPPPGFEDEAIQTGEDWFDEQSEDTQRAILGPTALDAFQNGDVSLSDFVHASEDPRWGMQRRVKTLRELGLR